MGEDFEPVFAMLMTTREDIVERVARITIKHRVPDPDPQCLWRGF